METLIKSVLDKYNTGRKKLPNDDLARLIVAHMKVGINGKKGWYLNLNSYDGQYENAKEMIKEYTGG
tara:strand:- start:2269 stop:2469 length:201 start_codon:yes stop_codon:yes gene_type:complete